MKSVYNEDAINARLAQLRRSGEVLPIKSILEYEICSSYWARMISNDWLQNQVVKYFVWKVSRKYKRYKWAQDVKNGTVKLPTFAKQ